jgi:hypothetical protein
MDAMSCSMCGVGNAETGYSHGEMKKDGYSKKE